MKFLLHAKSIVYLIACLLKISQEFETFSNCNLPSNWTGKWQLIMSYSTDLIGTINIQNNTIEDKGICESFKFDHDSYRFLSKTDEGYKYLLIIPLHENVLRIREDAEYHDDEATALENFGQNPNDLFYDLYRSDALAINCPFSDASYIFTYNAGQGECQNPISHLQNCTTKSKILFDFQSCPNVLGTESVQKILTCFGSWKEHNTHFLIGKMLTPKHTEDVLRCLSYKEVPNPSGSGADYKLSISETPSCSGLNHESGGHRVIHLKSDISQVSALYCQFSEYLVASIDWTSLNGSAQIKIIPNSNKMEIQEFDSKFGNQINYFLQCTNDTSIINYDEGYSVISAIKLSDCDRISVCLHFIQRSKTVMELEIFELEIDGKCSKFMTEFKNSKKYIFVANHHHIINNSNNNPNSSTNDQYKQFEKCPYPGEYLISKIKKNGTLIWKCSDNGLFNTLVIGSSSAEESISNSKNNKEASSIKIYSFCGDEPSSPAQEFHCLASWKENDATYIVVTQDVRIYNQNTNSIEEAMVVEPQTSCLVILNRFNEIEVTKHNDYCKESYKKSSHGEWTFNATLLTDTILSLGSHETSSSSQLLLMKIKVYELILYVLIVLVFINL